MSERRNRVRVASAAALGVVLLAAPGQRLYASHFSWLGHGLCPWPSARCESEAPAGSTLLGQFVPHFSSILDEASPEWARDTPGEPVLARDGHVIARVGAAFKQKLDVEGSARLRDGRVVNLDEPVGGRPRYLVVRNAPFGVGAPGYKLIPYRTVSVDPRRIELGTVLYLPALAGVTLPSGEIHDGFCFAHDMNDRATGKEIGLFVGFDGDAPGPLKNLSAGREVRVYQVDADTAAVLNRRFRSQFDWSG